LLKAANVTVESYWPDLFAKIAQSKNVDDLVLNSGAVGGAAVAVSAPASGGVAVAAAELPLLKRRRKPRKKVTMTWALVCLIKFLYIICCSQTRTPFKGVTESKTCNLLSLYNLFI
jgi:hypothetical protein